MFNLSNLVKAVVAVVKGTRKVTWSTLMVDLMGFIPGVLRDLDRVIEMKKDGMSPDEYKELIDAAMSEFDAATGVDGLSVIPGMPVDQQEIALDHFKKFLTVVLYNRAGVKGFTDAPETD
jgi:hypothetical protein